MENKAFELKIEDGGLRIEDRPSRLRISSCNTNIDYIHFCSFIVANHTILRTL